MTANCRRTLSNFLPRQNYPVPTPCPTSLFYYRHLCDNSFLPADIINKRFNFLKGDLSAFESDSIENVEDVCPSPLLEAFRALSDQSIVSLTSLTMAASLDRDQYGYDGLTGWRSYRALRPGRGIYHDIRRRLPHYRSDLTDALTYRTAASVIRMYFVKCVQPPPISFPCGPEEN